jgi:hypothetical protein
MKRRLAAWACGLLAVVLLLAWPTPHPLRACGPFRPYAVFTHATHPDFPLEGFAGGELGVLEPSYARSYLVVAWRMIEGPALTHEERRTAVLLWRQRLGGEGTLADPQPALRAWLRARSRVHGAPRASEPEIYMAETSRDDVGGSVLNCPDDAFRAALRSLDERIARWGVRDARTLAWLKAQDSVFAGCGDAAAAEPMPNEAAGGSLASGDPYQRACAAFYAGQHLLAERQFRALAQDPRSPWRPTALYLAARAIVRHATLSAGPGQSDLAELARADALLDTLLADREYASLRRWCLNLRGFVRIKLCPDRQLAALSASVRAGRADSLFGHDLADYTHLLNVAASQDRWEWEQDSARVIQLREASDRDELSDWLLTFQQCDAGLPAPRNGWYRGDAEWAVHRHGGDPYAHALRRWRATHRVAWLVVALAAAPAGEEAIAELDAAAAAVSPASPAWATLASLRARRALAAGRVDEARALADSALARPALPRSARNRFEDLRAAAATGFDDFARRLARRPAAVCFGIDGYANGWEDMLPNDPHLLAMRQLAAGAPRCFDEEIARTFNHAMPVRLWLAAATDSAVPARMRDELAIAGWTRAVLTGCDSLADGFAPALGAALPGQADAVADWRRAARGPGRAFAAAFLMLRTPAARPTLETGVGRLDVPGELDDYRDNWWDCSRERGGRTLYGDQRPWNAGELLPAPPALPAWLAPAERAELAGERARLDSTVVAPIWLGRIALDWARSHPDDPRVPEALHRVVRAVRLGAYEEGASNYARDAFRLLHRRYPASPWTRKTKVWG